MESKKRCEPVPTMISFQTSAWFHRAGVWLVLQVKVGHTLPGTNSDLKMAADLLSINLRPRGSE